mgnify:FL=1
MKAFVNTIAEIIERNRERLELSRRYRKTYRELSMLNDRDLADIGINRGMIEQIAFDHTYNTSR